MATTTKQLARRRLHFKCFDDVLADATRIHDEGYMALGHWSVGQALQHLGNAMVVSIDGTSEFRVPARIRLLGRFVFRYVILFWQFPPGVKLPARAEKVLVPTDDTPFEDAVTAFRNGVRRLSTETQRHPHPVIGKLSLKQWNRFHLRHAELHLSFFAKP